MPRIAVNRLSAASVHLSSIIVGVAAIAATVAISLYPGLTGSDVGEQLTRNTVRLSLAWYAAALFGMLRLQATDWRAATHFGRAIRWCWTWALLVFLVHLAMAFHFFDHWSHAAAFARTRQVSGTGEGLYFSYTFTALWLADAAYWWLAPRHYADRATWIGRGLHGFMLFIIFNGMVIFETGAIRYAGLLMFAGLALAWRLRPKLQTPVPVDQRSAREPRATTGREVREAIEVAAEPIGHDGTSR